MVGKVLTQNGIAEPLRKGSRITGYKLNIGSLSDSEKAALLQVCEERLADYIEKRGHYIWEHRAPSDGYVPGSVRYEVLKRARYRSELCGGHEEHVALHVDHIVPRARGGSDDISNFQALCITCNTNKRDKDDTDFRGVLASYQNRSEDCVFCQMAPDRGMSRSM